MKKKFAKALSLILALIMLAACVGCGGEKAEEAPKEESKTEAPAQTETKKEEVKKSDFPKRGINVIIPAKAGGDTDTYGRIFSTALEKELGVSVTVTNYDNSNVAMNDAKNADPDGYNLVFFHAAHLVSMIAGTTENDLFKYYTIVGVPVIDATSCVVFNGHRWKNMDEFMASVKAGEKIIGTCQQGSTGHLATAMFGKALDIDWTQVESNNQADRYADMLADRVDILYCQYGLISQYLETGDFICAGMMSEERNPFFPDVPTLKEQGYENASLLKPYFYAAPKDLDAEALEVLSAALEKACADAEVIAAMEKFACVPEYHNPADSLAVMEDTYNAYNQLKDVIAAG